MSKRMKTKQSNRIAHKQALHPKPKVKTPKTIPMEKWQHTSRLRLIAKQERKEKKEARASGFFIG